MKAVFSTYHAAAVLLACMLLACGANLSSLLPTVQTIARSACAAAEPWEICSAKCAAAAPPEASASVEKSRELFAAVCDAGEPWEKCAARAAAARGEVLPDPKPSASTSWATPYGVPR